MEYDFAGLPRRIKETREERGISREELGRSIEDPGKIEGVSRQAVARWEHPYGRDRNSVPDLETISRIAVVLRVDFLWLLTGQNYVPAVEGDSGTRVPVYSLDFFHLREKPLFHKRTLDDIDRGTYGFRVCDLSNTPEFMPGDVCFTELCGAPQPNKMMVARLTEKRVNIFAKCIISALAVGGRPIFDLVPLKEGYPRFSSRDEIIDLIAVVVEHHADLRAIA